MGEILVAAALGVGSGLLIGWWLFRIAGLKGQAELDAMVEEAERDRQAMLEAAELEADTVRAEAAREGEELSKKRRAEFSDRERKLETAMRESRVLRRNSRRSALSSSVSALSFKRMSTVLQPSSKMLQLGSLRPRQRSSVCWHSPRARKPTPPLSRSTARPRPSRSRRSSPPRRRVSPRRPRR